MVDSTTSNDYQLYPIRTVSELTGVNSITLRAWETRYGLIEPIRKESGHRMYRQSDINRVNEIVGLTARGIRVGQVKEFLDSKKPERNLIKDVNPNQNRWQIGIDQMLGAVIQFDEDQLEEVYNEFVSLHSMDTVTVNLIEPLLVELGDRWARQQGTIAEEHFFGCYLRNKIGARFHHRTRPSLGPKLILACLPNEHHEIGLLMFALAANNFGYRPIVLGANMPIDEIANAANKTKCDGIILAGRINHGSSALRSELAELALNTKIRVMIGGGVSAAEINVLKKLDIVPLGHNIQLGLKKLSQLIPSN